MIHSGRVIFFLLLLSSPSGDAFRIHTKKGRSSQKTVIKVGRELEKDGGRETHSNSGSLKPGELHGPEAHSNSGQILVDISSPRDIVGSKSSTQHSADRVDNASGDRQPITARILSEGNDSSQKNPDHTSETLPLLQLNESVLRQHIPTATSWSRPQDSSVEHGAPNVSRETKMTNSTATKTGQRRRQHIPTATSWSRPQDSSVDPEATSTSLLAKVGNARAPKTPAEEKMEEAAKKIQSVQRGKMARRDVAKLKEKTAKVVKILAISDPGQDMDDEMSYIMMAGLFKEGLIDVLGVVTTLLPEDKRAALARGTLNALGLNKVPVGIGSDGIGSVGKGKPKKLSVFEDESTKSYCEFENPSNPDIESNGQDMLTKIYTDAEPNSITLLIIASFKDVAIFMNKNLELFVAKTYEVVIMGGASFPIANGSFITPDGAHNQDMDKEASRFVFQTCQDQMVPLIIISQYAVKAVPFARDLYEELGRLSRVGNRMLSGAKASIENLWLNVHLPVGAPDRYLPERCDVEWFKRDFLGGKSPEDDGLSIFYKVPRFFQYDSMALLAAVPKLRRKFFEPLIVNVKGIEHKVIGIDKDTRSIKALDKAELEHRMTRGFVEIAMGSKPKEEAWVTKLAAKRQGTKGNPFTDLAKRVRAALPC